MSPLPPIPALRLVTVDGRRVQSAPAAPPAPNRAARAPAMSIFATLRSAIAELGAADTSPRASK